MIRLHKQQYATLKSFKKIVKWELRRVDELSDYQTEILYTMGSENGFRRDQVDEIIDDCLFELSRTAA